VIELAQYMPFIIATVALVVGWGSLAWRSTAFIVLAASLVGIGLSGLFTRVWIIDSENPSLYFVAGSVDTIAAAILLKYGSRGKNQMAKILAIFGLVNVVAMIQISFGDGWTYILYDWVIFALNCIQILLFSGGIYECVGRLRDGSRLLPSIHRPRHNNNYTLPQNYEARRCYQATQE